MELNVKNHTEVLIFHTDICFKKQIFLMSDEKSPARISHRIFATVSLRNGD